MTHSVRLSDQGEALAAIFSAQNRCAVDKFLSRLVEKQLATLCHDGLWQGQDVSLLVASKKRHQGKDGADGANKFAKAKL